MPTLCRRAKLKKQGEKSIESLRRHYPYRFKGYNLSLLQVRHPVFFAFCNYNTAIERCCKGIIFFLYCGLCLQKKIYLCIFVPYKCRYRVYIWYNE